MCIRDSCEFEAVAPFFPIAPVEPAELARYAGRDGLVLAPLLERAVRIAPERRAEALELLRPLVADMDDERLTLVAPALRWLSRRGRGTNDPRAWRLWMAELDTSGGLAGELGTGPEPLDLPADPPAGLAPRPALELPDPAAEPTDGEDGP